MLKRFLSSKQETIEGATIIIAVFVFLSKILALLRDRLLASNFGASADLDIYFAAFKIPDLIYGIIFAGGVLVSLLPLFSDYFKENKDKAWKLINNILNIFLLIFSVALVFFLLFTPQIVNLILPGLDPSYLGEAINLTRLIFVSVLFFSLSSLFSTVLNYFKRFVLYSLAPLLYNIGIILGIVFLTPHFGIYGPALGVVLGAFLHFSIQFWGSLKNGYKYFPILDFKDTGFITFVKLIVPRSISAATTQINFLVITALASTITVGAITIFNFSNNLRYLPVSLIGISFATAVFPHLSKSITDKNQKEFKESFTKTFLQVLFLAFPISILTFLMSDLIVEIILGVGAFSGVAVQITGACLAVFALTLFAQCLSPLLLRGYFSLKDTKTPTLIAICFLILNIGFSFGIVHLLKTNHEINNFLLNLLNLNSAGEVIILGLVTAFSFSMLFEFILLLIFFYKKTKGIDLNKIWKSFVKILFSSIIMSIFTFFALKILNLDGFWGYSLEFGIVTLFSFVIYFILGEILHLEEAKRIKKLIFRK